MIYRTVLALAVILPPLEGCAMYVPSVAYAPLPERAGEVRLRAGFGQQGGAATASLSPFAGALVFAGGEREWATDDTVNTRSRSLIGGGAGAYASPGGIAIVELLGGYDEGSITTSRNAAPLFGGPERVMTIRRGSMARTYGQLDVGARRRLQRNAGIAAAVAVSLRLSSVRFTELSETQDGVPQEVPAEEQLTVFEPGLVGSFTSGPLRFETGLRVAMPLGRRDYVGVEPLRTDIGVSLAVDRLFRPAEARGGGDG